MGRAGEALISLLGEHGVDEPAARIYLCASRHGPHSASELARMTALDRVQAYRWIKLLSEKGLLLANGRRPMKFAALPMPQLLDRWIDGAANKLERLRTGRTRLLSEWEETLTDPGVTDGGKFLILEGMGRIHSFLAKRIGLAEREILVSAGGFSLPFAVQGGIDRALKESRRRGVTIRLVTDISAGNLAEAKHFRTFTELRHAPVPVHNRAVVLDREGALVYVTGREGLGESEENQVAVWSTSPRFVRLARDYHRRLWSHGIPADTRMVEIDTPSATVLPVYADRQSGSLDRLAEIARLGMHVTGLKVLELDATELIEAVAEQLGKEVANELEGGTPVEVARSLARYYARNACGELDVVREDPLTLKVTGCFACTQSSPEIGRVLCPALLRRALETRLGGQWTVSKPDPRKHATRGCIFEASPI